MQMIFSIIGAAVGIIIAIIIFGQITANIECPQDTITPTENNLGFDLSTPNADRWFFVLKEGTGDLSGRPPGTFVDLSLYNNFAGYTTNPTANPTVASGECENTGTPQSPVISCYTVIDPRPMTDPHWLEGLLGEGKGYEACTQAKQTAWTILGILPVVLFFTLFTIFGMFKND